jgi:hypothetical protein
MAINNEVNLGFVVGYTPLEFRETLHMLAESKIEPLITGVVGLGGVAAASMPWPPLRAREDPDRPPKRRSRAGGTRVIPK